MRRSAAAERPNGAAAPGGGGGGGGDDEEAALPDGEPLTCAALTRLFERRPVTRVSLAGKVLADAPIQQCLARCLTTSQRLRVLSLGRSSCGPRGIGFLVEALLSAGACPLETLKLRAMGLTADAGAPLGRLLAYSRTLATLDASHNDLQAEGVMLLVEPLLSNPHVALELLDLGHNNVTQVDFPILEAVLTMHQRLQISLLGNPIKAAAGKKATVEAPAVHPPVLSCRSPRAEDLRSGVLVKPATQRHPSSPQRSTSTSPAAKLGADILGASSSELSSANGLGSPSAEALTSPSTPRTPQQRSEPASDTAPSTPQRPSEGMAVPKVGWRVLNMAAVAKLPSPRVDHPHRSRSAPSRSAADRSGSPTTLPTPFPVIQQVPTVSLGSPAPSPPAPNEAAEAARAQLAAQAALLQRLEAERDALKRDLTQTAASLKDAIGERDALRLLRPSPVSLDGRLELLRSRDSALADQVGRELHARLDQALLVPVPVPPLPLPRDDGRPPLGAEPRVGGEKPVQVLAAYRLSPRQAGRGPSAALAPAQPSPRSEPLEWPRSVITVKRLEEPPGLPVVANSPNVGAVPAVPVPGPGPEGPPRLGSDRRASTGSTVRRRQVAPPVTASPGRTTTREGLLGGAAEGWRTAAAANGVSPSVRYRAVNVPRPSPAAYLSVPGRKAQSLPSTGSGAAGAGTTIVGVRRVEHVAPRRAGAPDARHPSPRVAPQRSGLL